MNWVFSWRWLFEPAITFFGLPPSQVKFVMMTVPLITVAWASRARGLSVFFYIALIVLVYLFIAFWMAVVIYANKTRRRIIVQLAPSINLYGRTNASRLLPPMPDGKVAFLFNESELAGINRLVANGVERDLSYRPPDFSRMLVVRLKSGRQPDRSLKILSSAEHANRVRLFYLDQKACGANLPNLPNLNPLFQQQRYLNSAPEGVDAVYSWTVAGGAGEGIAIVDVEEGWDWDSSDLKRDGQPLITGPINGISSGDKEHGKQVLGVIAAQDNGELGIGVAHLLKSVDLAGYNKDNGSEERESAMQKAIAHLTFGDVISLPIQVTGWELPIEITPYDFDLIRLATANGIVVVEAAGNGGTDLDARHAQSGEMLLDPAAPGFRDSGAIVVGGADTLAAQAGGMAGGLFLNPPVGGFDQHARHGTSNFGARVNVFAWAENVVGLGDAFFDGTSAATAIIAGVTLSVQGVASRLRSAPLNPMQMRSLLQYLPTPSNPNNERIGVMPNLRHIIDYLENGPVVYIRDTFADNGSAHDARDCFESPDILIRGPAVIGAQVDTTIENAWAAGLPQSVFLRFRNKGQATATVGVTVLEIPNSTIPLPADIGRAASVIATMAVFVPVDAVTTVGPVPWTPSDIAHGILVMFDAPDNPYAPPAYFEVRRNFGRILRRHTNIACRKIRTIQNAQILTPNTPVADAAVLEFVATVIETDERFTSGFVHLDIDHNLPETAEIWLEGPKAFMLVACQPQKQDAHLAWLQMFGPQTLRPVTLLADAQPPAFRLLVRLNGADLLRRFRIQIRQLNGTEVVGQIGWNLVP